LKELVNILHITPNFNFSCGRSKLVYLYLKHFSSLPDYGVHFITNDGDALERIETLPDIKFKKMKFTTGIKNLFYQRSFYKDLKEYVVKNKIGLIHTHHRFPETVAVRISKELNIKSITSAHSFVKGFRHSSFTSEKIISVSYSITDHLKKNFNVTKEQMLTLYNPAKKFQEPDRITADKFRNEYNISFNKKILLFIGRISRDKLFDTLLKAFKMVTESIENIILIIIGQIEDKRIKFKPLLKSEKIIYIPPQRDVNFLYTLADIVVLPSRIDPFPFVMIEAGAFKKPFIGGNTGGIAEFIEDGKNGLLVDPENPRQLADKIIYLLNNPETGKLLGENLYEKVTRFCDYNNYFNEVEKIYNSLLIRDGI
jgi:glycosyltransferase involved in cell wall biosynthesis